MRNSAHGPSLTSETGKIACWQNPSGSIDPSRDANSLASIMSFNGKLINKAIGEDRVSVWVVDIVSRRSNSIAKIDARPGPKASVW